ncbi:hypothetical protein [Gracilibacillus suaedae]|uniref:hypothetical protein n=1 Tax=Gracilibacillus suaedae TaxID=2820273 RepID=UPI001ABE4250|nr:hypothetical protein [Gracilibacillus suaedae]
MEITINIWVFVIVMFILYIVIETAVRRGINSSVIGKYVEQKHSQVTKPVKKDLDD